MFFTGRKPTRMDVESLHNMDIKCFPFPWGKKEWEQASDTFECRLYKREGRDVAFWVGRVPTVREEEDTPAMKNCYQLVKLGVVEGHWFKPLGQTVATLEPARRQGLSRAMLPDLYRQARNWGKDYIRVCIPEYLLDARFPEYVGGWLTRVGFKKTGEIERASLYRYAGWWDVYEYKLLVP